MGGRPWTTADERLVAAKAGEVSVRTLASMLGRSESAVRTHASRMRSEGRLGRTLETDCDQYVSWLVECPECRELRSGLTAGGVCRVCARREQLRRNEVRMRRAWQNLPPALKRSSGGCGRVLRAPLLMTKGTRLSPPPPPDTEGMDAFDAAAATDEWLLEVEEHELAMLQLDIDAVKQRVSKWRRKTRDYEKSQQIGKMMKRK